MGCFNNVLGDHGTSVANGTRVAKLEFHRNPTVLEPMIPLQEYDYMPQMNFLSFFFFDGVVDMDIDQKSVSSSKCTER